MKYRDSKDVASDHFVGKWPSWLRWLLFLPATLIISVLGSTLFLVVVSLFTETNTGSFDGGWYRLMQSAILGGLFVYVGGFMAPKAQMSVAVILLVVLAMLLTLILSATMFLGNIEINFWYQSIHTLAALFGGGISMYSLYDAGAEFTLVSTAEKKLQTLNDPGKDRIDVHDTVDKDELVNWEKIKKG